MPLVIKDLETEEGAVQSVRRTLGWMNRRRREHAERVEHRFSLRMIVLAIGLWTALTLGWVGSPAWVWVGGALVLSTGHAYSWRYRGQRSVIRALLIATAIVASLPLVPQTVESGTTGNWLPAAHFMLMFQGIASFELRTRVGLYASIVLSGVVLFFATQQALDPIYGVFLTGFTALVLAFLAMAFLVDQVERSDVHWFKTRFGFAGFWIAVLIASLSLSTLAFLILPKDFMDPQNGLQGAVLPLRSSGSFDGQAPIPDFNTIAAALPQTSASMPPTQDSQSGDDSGSGGSEQSSQNGENGGTPSPDSQIDENSQTLGPPVFGGINSGSGFDPEDPESKPDDEDVVMQVRSPVLTYWKGQIFDKFNGSGWQQDDAFRIVRQNGEDSVVLQATQTGRQPIGPLYPQTFFIFDEPAEGTLFTGYAPLSVVVPSDDEGTPKLKEGSSYRVISTFPDFTRDALDRARANSRLNIRYHEVPEHMTGLTQLATEITGLAYTDLSRTQRIVSYLDTQYEYDQEARNQLQLSADPLDFLSDQDKGTSMDFATASVLLARASGIPARLVSGYLPGQLDPLSGTYVVRHSDAHVWAEIYFDGIGWVPFDSTPRPETAGFGTGGTRRSPLSNSVFRTSLALNVYDAVSESPNKLNDLLNQANAGSMALILLGAVISFGSFTVLAFLFIRSRRGQSGLAYSRIEGDGREEMLKIRKRIDRMLAKAGLGAKTPSDTIGERWDAATWLNERGIQDLHWLKQAAWAAAYNPAPFDAGLVSEARTRLERVRQDLQSRPEPS
ncbi:MAG: transglutaminase domain-containing protein [SAR202 cluster bacterium]|nr:transglutaminase domain-containing protein [SAR202 cluster bacterium]